MYEIFAAPRRANAGSQLAGAALVRWRPLLFYKRIEARSSSGITAIVDI
jgi:hypothetical protein